MLELLTREQEGSLVHLDATHVNMPSGCKWGGWGAFRLRNGSHQGRSKHQGYCLRGQSEGVPFEILVDAGNRADVKAAEGIQIPSEKRVVADKGFDSNKLREAMWDAWSGPWIPPLSTRKQPVRWHRGYYRKRHRVEKFFQRIKRYRRVATRYDKLALSFLAFVQLAGVLDWLRNRL
jgi:transposase